MTKFTEKSLHTFPMAFYYAAMKAMDDRTAAVETTLERFLTTETEFHRLFTAFDVAYKNSLKSQLTGHHQTEGRRARPHRLRDGARGKAVGRETGRPVAGHPRQARGAGVQGLRLPHDGGTCGREREDSEHGAAVHD